MLRKFNINWPDIQGYEDCRYYSSVDGDKKRLYNKFTTELIPIFSSNKSNFRIYHINDCTVVANRGRGRLEIFGRKKAIPIAVSHIKKTLDVKLKEIKVED